MKALSIKQPWAWLICAGYKDIENRDWRIGRKSSPGMMSVDWGKHATFPFRVYVHAGKQSDLTEETIAFVRKAIQRDIPMSDETRLKWRDVLTFGAIIGEVDVTGCVEQSDSPWFVGKYGFTLANPKLYEHPIPYRGQLGFFEVVIQSKEKPAGEPLNEKGD